MRKRDQTAHTIAFYDDRAAQYFEETVRVDMSDARKRLTDLLPLGGRVLDLGCGSGRDSKAFIDVGYPVVALDGAPALAALASQHIGQEVLVGRLQDIDFESEFDGVYAFASLLHLDDGDLVHVLIQIFRALRPGGHLMAAFKVGTGRRSDPGTGRVFNDMNEERARSFIERAGGCLLSTAIDADKMGRGNDWITVICARGGR